MSAELGWKKNRKYKSQIQITSFHTLHTTLMSMSCTQSPKMRKKPTYLRRRNASKNMWVSNLSEFANEENQHDPEEGCCSTSAHQHYDFNVGFTLISYKTEKIQIHSHRHALNSVNCVPFPGHPQSLDWIVDLHEDSIQMSKHVAHMACTESRPVFNVMTCMCAVGML